VVLLFLRSLTLCAVACLTVAGQAAAHLDVRPLILTSGRELTVQVELPALRPGAAPTALELRAPGVEQLRSHLLARLGEESRWQLDVRVETVPGPLEATLVVRFEDGATVEVPQAMTVVPGAGRSRSWIALLASGVGVAAGLGLATLGLLVLLRRRRAP